MKEVNDILLEWYKENKRELPWRDVNNPYYTWVSEIMLQQTRVEAVKPYFTRFINELPTICDLAVCEEDRLAKLWEGLGYYSRVRNMKKCAIECCKKYGGVLPSTYDELITLAGIGPYSAAAIASIAFNENKIAMDGNVMRVFSRILNIQKDIYTKEAKQIVYDFFEMYPCENMKDLNQAIMDFGSMICLPKNMARCNICPLCEHCKAYKAHTVKDLPIKKAKKQRRKEKYTVLLYVCNNQVLLHKRENNGLLAGLYEFILEEGHKSKKDFKNAIYLGKYKHIFSHIEWDLKGFLIECEACDKEGIWVDIEEIITTYSIPTAFSYYKEQLLQRYKSPNEK